MRHHVIKHSFGRKTGPRIALLKGLVNSLVEHGRIKVTVEMAKELRRHVERAVTMGKKGTLNSRRILMARYPNEKVVGLLMDDIAKRFAKREGGYTRIVKLGRRAGDNAPMSYIEFVDYQAPAAKSEETVTGEKGAGKKAKSEAKEVAKKKKTQRKAKVSSKRSK